MKRPPVRRTLETPLTWILAGLGGCSGGRHGATDPLAVPGELPSMLCHDTAGLLFFRSLAFADEALGGDPESPGPLTEWFAATAGVPADAIDRSKAAAMPILATPGSEPPLSLQPIFRCTKEETLERARRVKGYSQMKVGNYVSLVPGRKLELDARRRSVLTGLRPGDMVLTLELGDEPEPALERTKALADLVTGGEGRLPVPKEARDRILTALFATARGLRGSVGLEGNETRLEFSAESDPSRDAPWTSSAARDAADTAARCLPGNHSVVAVLGLDTGAALEGIYPALTALFGEAPAPLKTAYRLHFLLFEGIARHFGAGGALSFHGSQNGWEEALVATSESPAAFLEDLEAIARRPDFASNGVRLDSLTRAPYEGCQALQFRLVFEPDAFRMPEDAPEGAEILAREVASLLYGNRGIQVLACASARSIAYLVNLSDADARTVVRRLRGERKGEVPALLEGALADPARKPNVALAVDLRGLLRGSVEMRRGGDSRGLPPVLRGGPLPLVFWIRSDPGRLTGGGTARLREVRELWSRTLGG